MSKRLVFFFSVVLILGACRSDDDLRPGDQKYLEDLLRSVSPTSSIDYFKLPDSDDYLSIPQDPNNMLTAKKVHLGQLLFHETAIGVEAKYQESMQTFSCASCHHAEAGFQSGIRQGIGEGGMGFGLTGEGRVANPDYDPKDLDVQPVKTPSALNVAYQPNLLWNGQFGSTRINRPFANKWIEGTPLAANKHGFEGTETQAIAGMGVHRLKVDQNIVEGNGYKALFDEVFGHLPESDRYTTLNAALAIAAYERTLLPNEAPWQRWLRGDHGALSEQEIRGAILFFEKAQCYQCHSGPALNSMEFHALGMGDLLGQGVNNVTPTDPAHLGRASYTGQDFDRYKFKVPQLYNLEEARFFGHGATFDRLADVIRYKNEAVKQNPSVDDAQLSEHFKPLGLTDEEISDLHAFLSKSLSDPNLLRYVPDQLPSDMCFPNNDDISRLDLNCNG